MGIFDRHSLLAKTEFMIPAISRGNHFEGHLIQLDHTLQLKFRHLNIWCEKYAPFCNRHILMRYPTQSKLLCLQMDLPFTSLQLTELLSSCGNGVLS